MNLRKTMLAPLRLHLSPSATIQWLWQYHLLLADSKRHLDLCLGPAVLLAVATSPKNRILPPLAFDTTSESGPIVHQF